MEEPVRLACPQCELVYRLKRYTPGRAYSCKNCGGPLVHAEGLADSAEGRPAPETPRPAAAPMFDNSQDVAGGRSGIAAGRAPESDFSRLPKLIEELTARLDVLKNLELTDEESGPATRLVEINEKLETDLHAFREAMEERLGELVQKEADDRLAETLDVKLGELRVDLDERLGELHRNVLGVLEQEQDDAVPLEEVRVELRNQQALVAGRFLEQKRELERLYEAQKRELDALREAQREELEASRSVQQKVLEAHLEAQRNELAAHREMQNQAIHAFTAATAGTTIEVDIDDLADRLVAGIRGNHAQFMDPESGIAMDAMVRLADELVKEQSANSARIDKLAEEIRMATAGISKLEEWKGDLPERVADEIGQTVEARVVGPISGALAKQAPSILSDLQDNKLVDIVSRSVREAQRPLLREILSGGSRGGIPVWLFASVLLPLLLILGYLFLPGEMVNRGGSRELEGVSESLARIETGMNISADNEDRLRTIEEAVLDIHAEALAHVRNATALEAENRNLKMLLSERDQLMNEYKETLQTQVKRLREYEMRLVQLGVSPKTIGE